MDSFEFCSICFCIVYRHFRHLSSCDTITFGLHLFQSKKLIDKIKIFSVQCTSLDSRERCNEDSWHLKMPQIRPNETPKC